MSSTSTNKQPLLIDRPLIEVQVLTTAAVGNRNQDTYQVQGGQGPVLLVDMDRTLTDDDISGGIIDTIELVRNQSVPDIDFEILASGIATEVTYTQGSYVYVASGFFVPQTILSQTTKTNANVVVTSNTLTTVTTFSSGNLIHIPSGIPSFSSVDTSSSGTVLVVNQYDYIYVTDAGAVTSSGNLPSGIGIYQYSGAAALSGVPANFQFLNASGLVFLDTTPGSATNTSGYYLYTGTGLSKYAAAVDYTSANGFTRLGTVQPTYLYPKTFNRYDIVHVTTNAFVDNVAQLPNGTGVYQYIGEASLSSRPDTVSFISSNNFVFLGETLGSYDNGAGYYIYSATTSLTDYTRVTEVTEANGFTYIGQFISSDFDEVEVCFYHVRQKVNPVANDGDYKFLGSTKLGVTDTRADALLSMPHLSTPVPYVGGTASVATNGTILESLAIDKPLKNRGLFLQRGDALYVGLYATDGTSVNYAKGLTVIAQGGYY